MYVVTSRVIIRLEIILTYSYLENTRLTRIKHLVLKNDRGKDDNMDHCFVLDEILNFKYNYCINNHQ